MSQGGVSKNGFDSTDDSNKHFPKKSSSNADDSSESDESSAEEDTPTLPPEAPSQSEAEQTEMSSQKVNISTGPPYTQELVDVVSNVPEESSEEDDIYNDVASLEGDKNGEIELEDVEIVMDSKKCEPETEPEREKEQVTEPVGEKGEKLESKLDSKDQAESESEYESESDLDEGEINQEPKNEPHEVANNEEEHEDKTLNKEEELESKGEPSAEKPLVSFSLSEDMESSEDKEKGIQIIKGPGDVVDSQAEKNLSSPKELEDARPEECDHPESQIKKESSRHKKVSKEENNRTENGKTVTKRTGLRKKKQSNGLRKGVMPILGKRHRVSPKDGDGAPSKSVLKRICRRAGMTSQYNEVLEANEILMRAIIRGVVKGALLYMKHCDRKTVMKGDIKESAKRLRLPLYG